MCIRDRLGSKHVSNICPNWESRVSPGRHSRDNISPKLGVGGCFYVVFFWTSVSQKRFETSKCAQEVNYWKFKGLQIWFHTFFRYLKRFLRYFEKNCFWKNFDRCCGFKRLDLGQITLFFFVFFIAGNLVSPGQHSLGNVSAKLGVGGVFSRYFEPLYLKNCGTYQNEHEVLGRLRPYFLSSFHNR